MPEIPAATASEDATAAADQDSADVTTASIQAPVVQPKNAKKAAPVAPQTDATVADAAPMSGWAIQVASANSEDAAWSTCTTATASHFAHKKYKY